MKLHADASHQAPPSRAPWLLQPRLAAVVFDLDDTLYPERQFVESGFRAVAQWLEVQRIAPQRQVLAFLLGQSARPAQGNIFDRLLEYLGAPQCASAVRLVEVYRRHQPRIEPLPEIRELLATLRPRCRIGLISDGYLDVQRRKLDALQLGPFLDAVVFSDQWGSDAWKPAARPYREALRLLRVPPVQAVYVADNPRKDFLGARRAGMHSVRLRRSDGIYARDEPQDARYAPDVEVQTVRDLRRWLLDHLAETTTRR